MLDDKKQLEYEISELEENICQGEEFEAQGHDCSFMLSVSRALLMQKQEELRNLK